MTTLLTTQIVIRINIDLHEDTIVLSDHTVIMDTKQLFEEWTKYGGHELFDSLHRQTAGLKTCLSALMLATFKETNPRHLSILEDFLKQSHRAMNRFCDVVINCRRTIPVIALTSCHDYQKINLYSVEVVELVESFMSVRDYFSGSSTILIIFLRIVYKIRRKVELYLVAVNYWNV